MMSSRAASQALLAVILLAAFCAVACADVTGLGAFPNPFSPNGDGVYDTVEISYTLTEADSVEADIADSLGAVVRNLNAGDWDQEAGPHSYVWDGLDDSTEQQPDGRYTLTVATASGDTAGLSLVLDRTAPEIRGLLVSPSRFTPDGDGVSDSTLVEFTLRSIEPTDRFWVEVTDPGDESTLVLLTGTALESVSVFWTGDDQEGEAAADTVYTVNARTVDAAGNEDVEETMVDLDVDPPALFAMYSPDPDTTEIRVAASAETTVVGSAYDRAGVAYVMFSLDGGETWTSPGASRSARDGTYLSWSGPVACEACTLGVRDDTTAVLVRGHDATLTEDGLGHYNTESSDPPVLSFDVVFDVAGPVHVSSYTDDDDATYENGQEISITSFWDAEGYTIEADFSSVDSAVDSLFDMTDVLWEDKGDGRYSIDYTASAGNSLVPVVDAAVAIRATDPFGRAVTDTTVTVTVIESADDGVTGLSVDRNSFDPTESEEVTIALGEGAGGATVDIYNLAGTLVRTLEAGSADAVPWNGRNDSGEVAASGVYFLHITTSAGDATLTVAIVK
ncbi:MAG: hypothetical protein GF400_09205 [Candidatus Eisenbacteria bacterium]|nr:hypothetical protein [Candidatus Eisenbacteria bacterium]